MCFQIGGKSAQAAKFIKSRIINKVIDCVLFIGTFEQQCVVFKGILQSPRLKYHMKHIGIDQSLINSALFDHIYLQNIMKLFFFFFCTSLRDPIACSILGGLIPSHNNGYKLTRLCPSYVYRMIRLCPPLILARQKSRFSHPPPRSTGPACSLGLLLSSSSHGPVWLVI